MAQEQLQRLLQAALELERGGTTFINPEDASQAEQLGLVEIVNGRVGIRLTKAGREALQRLATSGASR